MDPAANTTTESRLDATQLGELLERAKALLAEGAQGGALGGAHDRSTLASKLRSLIGEAAPDTEPAEARPDEPLGKG